MYPLSIVTQILNNTYSGCRAEFLQSDNQLTISLKVPNAIQALETYVLHREAQTAEAMVQQLSILVQQLKSQVADCAKLDSFESMLVRQKYEFPQWKKIQMHNQVCSMVEQLPTLIPKHATYILVGIYMFHGNHPNGHAYLCGNMYQQGNPSACVKLQNYSYNEHYCSGYYEIQVPWSAAYPNAIQFDVTSTYNTGSYSSQGNVNYYTVTFEGYHVCGFK